MAGVQGCHHQPNNGVLDMGIQVTRSILLFPYSPGTNGAGDAGQRCSRQMPQLCPAHWGSCSMCPAMPDPCILPGTRSLLRVCNVPSSTLVSTGGHYTHRLPWGRAVWGLHQLPAAWHRLHCPVLPAPITTASYSCCSCFVAPAWASRTAGSPRDRCQPHSQRDRQPVPSLAQSTAAIAPQCLATAVLCPTAWTLLSQQNFSQCFWAWGGDGARPGNALAQGHTLCPRACGEAEQNNGTGTMLPTQRCLQQGTEPWQSLAGRLWGGWRPAPVLRR